MGRRVPARCRPERRHSSAFLTRRLSVESVGPYVDWGGRWKRARAARPVVSKHGVPSVHGNHRKGARRSTRGNERHRPGRTSPPPCTVRRTACPEDRSHRAGKVGISDLDLPQLRRCRRSDTPRNTCLLPPYLTTVSPPPLAQFCTSLPNHGPRRARGDDGATRRTEIAPPCLALRPCHFGRSCFSSFLVAR